MQQRLATTCKLGSKLAQRNEQPSAFSAGHVMMRNNTVHDAFYQYGPEGLIDGPSITAYASGLEDHPQGEGHSLHVAQLASIRMRSHPGCMRSAYVRCIGQDVQFIQYFITCPFQYAERCVAADILWQPSSLPVLGLRVLGNCISSTM